MGAHEISRYRAAALEVWNSRKGDKNLVRESAKTHGVSISNGYFFNKVIPGAYNPRLPYASDREAKEISRLSSIKRLCMDYRGSSSVGQIDSGSVAWIDAGGALQPERNRFEIDMNMWDAIFALNPDIFVQLYYHIDICGGGNHFTGGEVKRQNELGGRDNEDSYVYQNYVRPYYETVQSLRNSGGVSIGKMW